MYILASAGKSSGQTLMPQRAVPLSPSDILASVTHVANMICAE